MVSLWLWDVGLSLKPEAPSRPTFARLASEIEKFRVVAETQQPKAPRASEGFQGKENGRLNDC